MLEDPIRGLNVHNSRYLSVLTAAGSSNLGSMQALLRFGADINSVDRKGYNAIFHLLLDISAK